MKKQKSLRQLAKELKISPAYLSMILNGQRKCPDKLRGTLYSFTNVHKTSSNGAWKAGTLPTELLPLNRVYFSRKVLLLSKDNSPIKKLGPDSSQIRYMLRI